MAKADQFQVDGTLLTMAMKVLRSSGAPQAGGEVQDDVDVCRADALGHLTVELHVAPGLAGFGVADMAVDDGGTGLSRIDGRIGDLFGRTRHVRRAILRAAGPGHGTRN